MSLGRPGTSTQGSRGGGISSTRWAVFAFLLIGCQTPPIRSISDAELLERREGFLHSYQADLERISAGTERRIRSEVGAEDGESGVLDVLILSGGGAFGAFGAGFLDGWGQLGEHELARPHFDQVSGISTGALIAPFAYLGTDEAYEQVVDLYENPGRNWVRRRGLIPYLPGNVSLYDVSKLHSKIRETINEPLVEAIGREAAQNRQLLIGALNADYGLLRVWDLAHLASTLPRSDAADRVAAILLASSAIPGAFPPIEIDDYLYVDGGAAMQVVGGLEDRRWLYEDSPQPPEALAELGTIRIRAWIIVNQKLLPDPEVVRSRWTSIAARSLSTLIRTSTLQSIQDAHALLSAIDRTPGFEAEFRYIAIPQDFPIPESDDMFDAATMRALVELGRELGQDPTSWRQVPLRPGAPFELAD